MINRRSLIPYTFLLIPILLWIVAAVIHSNSSKKDNARQLEVDIIIQSRDVAGIISVLEIPNFKKDQRNRNARAAACAALVKIGTPEATQALLQSVMHAYQRKKAAGTLNVGYGEDFSIMQHGIRALGQMSDTTAVDTLLFLLVNCSVIDDDAADALRAMASPSLVAPLTAVLRDSYLAVREWKDADHGTSRADTRDYCADILHHVGNSAFNHFQQLLASGHPDDREIATWVLTVHFQKELLPVAVAQIVQRAATDDAVVAGGYRFLYLRGYDRNRLNQVLQNQGTLEMADFYLSNAPDMHSSVQAWAKRQGYAIVERRIGR